jgi:hypothetical protein
MFGNGCGKMICGQNQVFEQVKFSGIPEQKAPFCRNKPAGKAFETG